MSKREDFDYLVQLAMQTDGVNLMRPVIEKELLHYDILYCLDKEGLLDNLVFQGGTSLRLCYSGNRYSEDLDFAGGHDFDAKHLLKMKDCLEAYVGSRYGLAVTVKEPKQLKQDATYAELNINKWQIAVNTSPAQKNLPHQKIKIEVANIPAYSKQPMSLSANYAFLPDGYSDVLILTETLDEILAYKLIALPATQKYVCYRDIWDLTWLVQQGATLNIDLVQKKIVDYQLEDFNMLLERLLQRLPDLIEGDVFRQEMKRFVAQSVFERTLAKDKFSAYMLLTLNTLFAQLKLGLQGELPSSEFTM